MTVSGVAAPALRPAPPRLDPVVVARGVAAEPDRPFRRHRLVVRVFLVALAVAVVVVVTGGLVARHLAETEAIRDAAVRTELMSHVAEAAIGDGLVDGRAADVAGLDARVREAMLGPDVARVKVWSADGTVVYSDEPRLVGERFELEGEELEALDSGETEAEVSDLAGPENRFERGHGPLLEVYRSVRTPDGTPLLFEVYYRYGDVLTSSEHILAGFVAVTAGSLLLFLLALLPLLHGLVRAVERAREQREVLLLKALDASDAERRRIAAAVHDGPVQELVGASYRLGAAAGAFRGTGPGTALEEAERAVLGTLEGLRDSLVDLYPAALSETGLGTALGDLAAGARARGAVVVVRVEPPPHLGPDAQRLLFRIARETLANAVKHAGEAPVTLTLVPHGVGAELSVTDRGPGFDIRAAMAAPAAGHFGLRLLQDAVVESGTDAELTVVSSPAGTTWRLLVT